ncbi:alpha/beta fold hydrolase [Desulfococcus sp.]|uniref:alpha/beta fold hydrolase n=1 Tax=Desulfococcus sp. TaxID=2025834 RepID=UPI0035942537
MKMNKKQIRCLAAGLMLALGAGFWGCALLGGNDPLKTLSYVRDDNRPATSLIVFLKGRSGNHESFAEEGFVADVWDRGLLFDMMAPDAHIGYYFAETLVPRLKADVIDPARARGVERIWLVGVSMGGLGSLMYLRTHPGDLAGVCLIAPFLGYQKIVKEVSDAGGVRKWNPGTYDPDDDWERMFWDWLKTYAGSPGSWPPVYLGYGGEDDFTLAQGMLSDILPRDRVFVIDGGHDPATMKALWGRFLDAGGLGTPAR